MYRLCIVNATSLTSHVVTRNDSILHLISVKIAFHQFFYELTEMVRITHSWSELALIPGRWPDA